MENLRLIYSIKYAKSHLPKAPHTLIPTNSLQPHLTSRHPISHLLNFPVYKPSLTLTPATYQTILSTNQPTCNPQAVPDPGI